jgi:hypothetical protein
VVKESAMGSVAVSEWLRVAEDVVVFLVFMGAVADRGAKAFIRVCDALERVVERVKRLGRVFRRKRRSG